MAVYDLAKTKLILDSGANANAETKAKLTPLAIAALLIDKGAHLSAALFGDLDLMRLLLSKGAKVSDSPNLARNAAAGYCLECLWIALDGGASPNGPANGRSALQDAAAFDQLEMVRLLVEKGADIQAADKRGYTALMRAALSFALRFGDTSIVRMLRNAGAPDAKTAIRVPPALTENAIRNAVERTLPLLQRIGEPVYKLKGCTSCHHNSLPAMVVSMARTRGLKVDDASATKEYESATEASRK